jgi:predicted MFS family arabinose efflux permease
VTGTLRFFSGGALPVGVLLGGYLLEGLGVRSTTLAITAVIAVLAVVFTAVTLAPPPPPPDAAGAPRLLPV